VRQGGSETEPDRPEESHPGTPTLLFNRRCTQFASYQIYRRMVKNSKRNSHPNVVPVILVSEAEFPFCIMSPWMPDGNITQYTQVNPDADRLMFVRAYRWRLGIIY